MERRNESLEFPELSFPAHGWIMIDKPQGISSAYVVAVMKRLLGKVRTGHGGTLDPLATGMLPIAFGAATRTTEILLRHPKKYSFDVRWGLSTTTDDAGGDEIQAHSFRPSLDNIRRILPEFYGDIWQVPPIYSALKLQGERSYHRARRGEAVCHEARKVTIYSLTWQGRLDSDHDRFDVTCGRGTYVRSLARDLGHALGTTAHVTALRRTSWGPFKEKDMHPLDYFRKLGHIPKDMVISTGTAVASLPKLECCRQEAEALGYGRKVKAILTIASQENVALFCENHLVALGVYDGSYVQPWCVFEPLKKKR